MQTALSTKIKNVLDGANGRPSPMAALAASVLLGTRLNDLASLALTTNGNGASMIGVEDSAAYFTGTTVEAVLAELYVAATSAGADTFTDSAAWYATDTVNAAYAEIAAAIGGTDGVTRPYTNDNVVADDEALVTSIDKLDTAFGDRAYTDDNLLVDDETITASLDKLDQAFGKMMWTMPVLGTWAADGDGAVTNGGGTAGAAVADLTLTNQGAAYAKAYDVTDAAFLNVALTSGFSDWTANYQVTPDAATEEIGDYVAFGADLPFAEIGFNLTTPATWGGDGGVWEYWNGAAWVAIPAGTFYDNTDTTDQTTGLRAFQQAGCLTFYPPSDWATTTIDGQLAYFIRYRVTAAQLTQAAVLNSVQHDIITPTDGWPVPHKGVVNSIQLEDGATTLHTAADVKFFLMNTTTGVVSALNTFPQDQRRDYFNAGAMAVDDGDVLAVYIVQEDGTNEVTNAMLSLEVAYSD